MVTTDAFVAAVLVAEKDSRRGRKASRNMLRDALAALAAADAQNSEQPLKDYLTKYTQWFVSSGEPANVVDIPTKETT